MDIQGFARPDGILRPAPFWAINDRITPGETGRQMADMIDVGLSGGFFHSRHGLTTDYLSDEWFAAMEAALDVAREKDGYLWLYDEDLWPSGNAGGQVAGMKDEYRSTTLMAEFVPFGEMPLESEDEFRAAYVLIERQGSALGGFRQVGEEEVRSSRDGERVIFRRHYAKKTPWWSGESYANLLHPEAVQQFIHLTHERYAERLGHEFGGRIPGIFTDEPQIAQGPSSLPWWDGIPGVYGEWHGRDFWSDLPYMFFEGPEARMIRLLVNRTVLRQFCEAYDMPLYHWCEENGLELTGHFNAEDDFEGQIACHCGSVMTHYRHMQAPGIDHLCRQIDGFAPGESWLPMLLTVKQVGSAARQLGRKRVLTEIFGVTRHTTTFEEFKWIGDFDLVLGANFFVPHLALYSNKGRRKRDYPPNWNYQQTYWSELKPLNDYFTRVSHALTRGCARPDVLVLHPIEGATASHRYGFDTLPQGLVHFQHDPETILRSLPADVPREDWSHVRQADRGVRKSLKAALNAGHDCDLGDEGYLEDLGSVEGALFRIGEMSYSVVVVPPSETWRPKTFSLLREFAGHGGRVILLGTLPTELDCREASQSWRELAGMPGVLSVPASARQLQDALDKVTPWSFRVRDTDGRPVEHLYVQHRVDGAQDIYFIVNSDRNRAHDYVMTFRGRQDLPAAVWNPLDASVNRIDLASDGDNLRYEFTLPAAGSLLLVTGRGAADQASAMMTEPQATGRQIVRLPEEWEFSRSEENVLVMDRVNASLDGGESWFGEDLEFRIRNRLAEHFGVTDALMWQPWVAKRKGIFEGRGGKVTLRYRFMSAIGTPRSAYLVMEDLSKGRVSVNGVEVSMEGASWHWDRSFGKVEITDLVNKGENVVDFLVDYDFLTEVEAAYVVGDFGVRLAGPYSAEITDEPSFLSNGSWVDQGYPFYSGSMTYRTLVNLKEGRSPTLKLMNPSGVLYKVKLNGAAVGSILWRPYELDLAGHTKHGANELEIEVISSRQNTFGPLHEREGEDRYWVNRDAFQEEHLVREEYSLFDYGLLGGAELNL